MRSDMAAVVTERPRNGSSFTYHDQRVHVNRHADLETLDDLPKKQGYRRPYKIHHQAKSFTDLLGPLEGFIRSKIGQKWDDAYSEICEHINPDSTIQIHILGHVFDLIETKTFIGQDGEVWVNGRFGVGQHIRNGDMYVHPVTGLVCMMPKKRIGDPRFNRATEHLQKIFGNNWPKILSKGDGRYSDNVITEAKRHMLVGPEKELHKINGIWYWAVFSDVPKPLTLHWFNSAGEDQIKVIRRGADDFLTKMTVTEGRYRSDKRQANSRDLRRYHLTND